MAGVCPSAARKPPTHIEGIGADAIRCNQCGAPCAPFEFTNGYTIAFDEKKQVGVTLEKEGAQKVAADGRRYMQTPDHSIQNPVVTLADTIFREWRQGLRPFIGQLGLRRTSLPRFSQRGGFWRLSVGVLRVL